MAVDATWCVSFLNDRARHLMRRPGLQAGTALQDLIPDVPGSKTWAELRRAVNHGVAVDLDVFYPDLFMWHEVRAIPDGQGGLALLLRDVTDRQWTIQKDVEHAYLRSLFSDAPIAISILHGPKHQFEYSNEFARNLVGGRVLEGLTVREAFPELEGQGFFELLDQVYNTAVPFHGERMHAVLTLPGTQEREDLIVNTSYIPLRGFDAQVSGILALSVNMTPYVT